jgi:hypothetical protein
VTLLSISSSKNITADDFLRSTTTYLFVVAPQGKSKNHLGTLNVSVKAREVGSGRTTDDRFSFPKNVAAARRRKD